MEFIIYDVEHSVRNIEDLCGYKMLPSLKSSTHQNELELVRSMGVGEYPRFRLMVETLNGEGKGHRFHLWLEKSENSDSHAHAGSQVEREMKRIKGLLT